MWFWERSPYCPTLLKSSITGRMRSYIHILRLRLNLLNPSQLNKGRKRKERSKEVESESDEDDEYSSSEDEGEVFFWGALIKKKRGTPKEYLPKHQEPVVNPRSVEERVKRKET
jgi:hypothetical protein